VRRDHKRALKAARADLERLQRAPSYVAAVLDTAERFFAHHLDRPLRGLERRDVVSYLAARVEAGCGASMPARELSMLRTFFKALLRQDLARLDPTIGLSAKRPGSKPPVYLSEDVVEALLAAALKEEPGRRPRGEPFLLRDRVCLELIYGVGLRDAEVRAARTVDLDLEDGSILVRAVKRGRWRRAPLPPRSIGALERYLQDARPLLLGQRADPGFLLLSRWGKGLSQSATYRLVQRVARIVGTQAHPHAFRRAVASHLVQAGVAVPAVQALLGHQDLATTARYIHVSRDDLHQAVSTLEAAQPNGECPPSVRTGL